jgi:hypothetical protein
MVVICEKENSQAANSRRIKVPDVNYYLWGGGTLVNPPPSRLPSNMDSQEWVPKFDYTTEWIAAICIGTSTIMSLACLVAMFRGWLRIPTIYPLMVMMHIVNIVQMTMAIAHGYFWRANVWVNVISVGSSLFLTLLLVLSQMEILKIFSVLCVYWTPRRITWMQIGTIILHLALGTGHYLHTGLRMSGITVLHDYARLGLLIWLMYVVLIENVIVFYQAWLLYRHVQTDKSAIEFSPNATAVSQDIQNTIESNVATERIRQQFISRRTIRLIVFLLSITFLDLLGIMMNSADMIINDSLSDGTKPGRLGYSFMQLSICVLGFHCISVCFVIHFLIEFKFGKKYVNLKAPIEKESDETLDAEPRLNVTEDILGTKSKHPVPNLPMSYIFGKLKETNSSSTYGSNSQATNASLRSSSNGNTSL